MTIIKTLLTVGTVAILGPVAGLEMSCAAVQEKYHEPCCGLNESQLQSTTVSDIYDVDAKPFQLANHLRTDPVLKYEPWAKRTLSAVIGVGDQLVVDMNVPLSELTRPVLVPAIETSMTEGISDYYTIEPDNTAGAVYGKSTTDGGYQLVNTASISKSISVIVGMKLEELGLLSIDDTIASHLGSGWLSAYMTDEMSNEVPTSHSDQVTLKHLYSMTSGIKISNQVIQSVEGATAPGTTFYYGQVPLVHAFHVYTHVTGKTIQQLTQEYVFGPLGLHDSVWLFISSIHNTTTPWAYADFPVAYVTTAPDLYKIARSLGSGTLLRKEMVQRMMTPQTGLTYVAQFGNEDRVDVWNDSPTSISYGLGILTLPYDSTLPRIAGCFLGFPGHVACWSMDSPVVTARLGDQYENNNPDESILWDWHLRAFQQGALAKPASTPVPQTPLDVRSAQDSAERQLKDAGVIDIITNRCRDDTQEQSKNVILLIGDGNGWEPNRAAAILVQVLEELATLGVDAGNASATSASIKAAAKAKFAGRTLSDYYTSGKGSGLAAQNLTDFYLATNTLAQVQSPNNFDLYASRGGLLAQNPDYNHESGAAALLLGADGTPVVFDASDVTDGGMMVGWQKNKGGLPWDSSDIYTGRKAAPDEFDYYYRHRRATDSAAAASAIATGVKTAAGMISVDLYEKPTTTIAEAALECGKSAGVISSVPMLHATPAAFVSHSNNRNDDKQLSRSMLRVNPTLIMGACPGNSQPTPEQMDELRAGKHGKWTVLAHNTSVSGAHMLLPMRDLDPNNGDHLLACTVPGTNLPFRGIDSDYSLRMGTNEENGATFDDDPTTVQTSDHYPADIVYSAPKIADQTEEALNFLAKNEKGFFLMVEQGDIDWTLHQNHMDDLLGTTLDLDDTVKRVVQWIDNNGGYEKNALYVIADHDHFLSLAVNFPEALATKIIDGESHLMVPGNHVKSINFDPQQEYSTGFLSNLTHWTESTIQDVGYFNGVRGENVWDGLTNMPVPVYTSGDDSCLEQQLGKPYTVMGKTVQNDPEFIDSVHIHNCMIKSLFAIGYLDTNVEAFLYTDFGATHWNPYKGYMAQGLTDFQEYQMMTEPMLVTMDGWGWYPRRNLVKDIKSYSWTASGVSAFPDLSLPIAVGQNVGRDELKELNAKSHTNRFLIESGYIAARDRYQWLPTGKVFLSTLSFEFNAIVAGDLVKDTVLATLAKAPYLTSIADLIATERVSLLEEKPQGAFCVYARYDCESQKCTDNVCEGKATTKTYIFVPDDTNYLASYQSQQATFPVCAGDPLCPASPLAWRAYETVTAEKLLFMEVGRGKAAGYYSAPDKYAAHVANGFVAEL